MKGMPPDDDDHDDDDDDNEFLTMNYLRLPILEYPGIRHGRHGFKNFELIQKILVMTKHVDAVVSKAASCLYFLKQSRRADVQGLAPFLHHCSAGGPRVARVRYGTLESWIDRCTL